MASIATAVEPLPEMEKSSNNSAAGLAALLAAGCCFTRETITKPMKQQVSRPGS
jgi:hypothetical protein